MVDAISAIVGEENLRGDRSLLMLKLRAVAKSHATGYLGLFEFFRKR
ncbi:MAG: hypothetical protein QQW96_00290 [Tychonema bourrellyi B0820]|nr:hypothetical protein [Tychonema bourrellyi]MDQ2096078.1 hypothetical protein [Tychonema bourrellyi B0820]